MTTIYQVSKHAGVSLATVSRVVNGKQNVSNKTRDKVEAAMQELGYQPNAIAQSLASSKTNSVGLVVSELAGPFFGAMICSIERTLKTAGKYVVITAGHSETEKEKQAIEFLLSRKCDALILQVEATPESYLLELHRKGIAFTLINQTIPELRKQCFEVDNFMGGYLATQFAIENGHKQIAYISGPKFKKDALQRFNGHKQALENASLPFNDTYCYSGDYRETGGATGLKWLYHNAPPFSAVICANDEMAIGAMKSARELSLNLPEDLAVMGFDDTLFAQYLHPSLTTINNPVNEMGVMAANWVLQNVYEHKVSPIKNQFLPNVVVRESLGKNNNE